jgi:hypothetical protein
VAIAPTRVPGAPGAAFVPGGFDFLPKLRTANGGSGLLPSRGRRLAPSVVTGNKRLTRLFPGEWCQKLLHSEMLTRTWLGS